jgi:SAM-dependent methyltransferase
MFAPEVLGPTVDVLADLAGTGRALEFAIGTGRVGLALAARGVPVAGIELSPHMIAQLRAKPGAGAVEVVEGDMATTRVAGEFSLVYLVFNTISNLVEQDEQVACFVNAARHLAPGGRFLVEVFVPELQRLPPGEDARPFDVSPEHLGFDTYDLVACRLTSHHVRFSPDGTASRSVSHHRYAWPAEYDLMARLAGLRRESRWSGWDRSEFTAASRSHVSTWRRAP